MKTEQRKKPKQETPVTDIKTASFVDKSGWDRGPWDDEPDRVEWRVPDLPRLACLIVRGPLGSLCGYVGLPPGHPAHGLDWNSEKLDVQVHGGLTYAAPCQAEGGRGPDALLCHVPEPGESDDVWWLGFDCGHAWDISPEMVASMRAHVSHFQFSGGGGFMPEVKYRDVAYVRGEVESLARQLAGMEGR